MVHSFPVSGYRAGLHDIYFNVLYMKMSISNFIYHIPLADKPRLEAQFGQMLGTFYMSLLHGYHEGTHNKSGK